MNESLSDSITFKLPTALRAELEKLAAKDGRSLSDFIRRHFTKRLNVKLRGERKA
jgi:molybdopterin-guanine dinucleotide biosynthesis protein A